MLLAMVRVAVGKMEVVRLDVAVVLLTLVAESDVVVGEARVLRVLSSTSAVRGPSGRQRLSSRWHGRLCGYSTAASTILLVC